MADVTSRAETTPELPTEPVFTPEVSDRICAHMNDDHADAVLVYAQVYGQVTAATAAKMSSIDATGMDLQVDCGDQPRTVRIPFDRTLTSRKDAHDILIEMLKKQP
jgi:putative heme iron utilization protein